MKRVPRRLRWDSLLVAPVLQTLSSYFTVNYYNQPQSPYEPMVSLIIVLTLST